VATAERADAVLDASAVVELLLGTPVGVAVSESIRARHIHAPAHMDAEVLSALGRLQRAEALDADAVGGALTVLSEAPITRHELPALLSGAWAVRDRYRLADALYVQLARALGSLSLITTDARLAATCEIAELVEL
jgi:predicted nucleic acid-binding protein